MSTDKIVDPGDFSALNVSALKRFVCPMDGLPLFKKKNTLCCEKGHVFDVAREGYCNLLLVQQKASLNPGDNKFMVAARRRFLDGGHFAPIADYLFETVAKVIKKHRGRASWHIVDAGCGEGYYLHQLSKFASAKNLTTSLELSGCDISKWAVKSAAKRSAGVSWAVASNRQLPFAPGRADVILSMFSYPHWDSFKVLQSAGGYVFLADPGPDHLIELRKVIYPQLKRSAPPPLPTAATEAGYVLEHQDQLKFSMNLPTPASIEDLLAMTPHFFRITPKAREEAGSLKNFTVSADVVFRVLRMGERSAD